GELDGERQSVEVATDPGRGPKNRFRQAVRFAPDPREEQANGLGPTELIEGCIGCRRLEGRDEVVDLTRNTEDLSARAQHTNVLRGCEDSLGHLACSPDDVLAVVEDDQHLAVAQRRAEALERWARTLAQADRGGELWRDEVWLGNGGQVDEHRAI